MDRDSISKMRIKAREILEKMTIEEVSFTIGRYCGRSNQFLSEKKYGFHMPLDIAEEVLANKTLEESLFGE